MHSKLFLRSLYAYVWKATKIQNSRILWEKKAVYIPNAGPCHYTVSQNNLSCVYMNVHILFIKFSFNVWSKYVYKKEQEKRGEQRKHHRKRERWKRKIRGKS